MASRAPVLGGAAASRGRPARTRRGSVPSPDVILVRWPEEGDRLERLRHDGSPRLVLVAAGAPPPSSGDCVEDWIRLPVDDADVRVRLASLSQRWARHRRCEAPDIDAAGRLRFMGRWVALATTEQRVARAFIERTGSVVGHDELRRVGWPGNDDEGSGRLRVLILRLRRHVEPLGLSIRTVPGRGYVLEPTARTDSDA